MARLTTWGNGLEDVANNFEVLTMSANWTNDTVLKRSIHGTARAQLTQSACYAQHRIAASPVNTQHYFRIYAYFRAFPTNINPDLFYFYPTTEVVFVSVDDGIMTNDAVTLTIDGSGTVRAYGSVYALVATATRNLRLNEWECIELSVIGSGGVFDFTLRYGGQEVMSAQAGGIVGGFTTFAFGVNLDSAAGDATVCDVDVDFADYACNNTAAGGNETSWAGEGLIYYFRPAGDGDNHDMVHDDGTAGDANNYTEVNETPPNDDTSYVKRVNTGTPRDLYRITDPFSMGMRCTDVVKVAHVGIRFRSIAVGAGRLATMRYLSASGGSNQDSASISFSTLSYQTNSTASVKTYPITLYVDPATAVAIAVSGANSLSNAQIGWAAGSSSTNELRVTAMWLVVEIQPRVCQLPAMGAGN